MPVTSWASGCFVVLAGMRCTAPSRGGCSEASPHRWQAHLHMTNSTSFLADLKWRGLPPELAWSPGASRSSAGAAVRRLVAASSWLAGTRAPWCQAGGDDVVRGEGVAAHDVDTARAVPSAWSARCGLRGRSRRRRSRRCGLRSLRSRSRRGTRSVRVRRLRWGGCAGSGTAVPTGCASGFRRTPSAAGGARCTHQARRTTNRRGHGSSEQAVTTMAARTISAQIDGAWPRRAADGGDARDENDGQFGAEPPQDPGRAVVDLHRQAIQDVGVVAVVTGVGLGGIRTPPDPAVSSW